MSLPHQQPVEQLRPRPARWVVGYMVFAAMTMVLSGFFQVVEGIAALSQNEIYLNRIGYLFSFDLPVWGGIHLFIGVLLMAAGFTLRTAKLWSRVVGIAFAGLSMIVNFLFLPYYPTWSSVIIALDVIVILGAVHLRPGRSVRGSEWLTSKIWSPAVRRPWFREPGFSKERQLEPQITIGPLTDPIRVPVDGRGVHGRPPARRRHDRGRCRDDL